MQFPELTWNSMNLHEVSWACTQFPELACSFKSLCAVPFFVWAAHKNFVVLVVKVFKLSWLWPYSDLPDPHLTFSRPGPGPELDKNKSLMLTYTVQSGQVLLSRLLAVMSSFCCWLQYRVRVQTQIVKTRTSDDDPRVLKPDHHQWLSKPCPMPAILDFAAWGQNVLSRWSS